MSSERFEKSPYQFWLNVCGFDTRFRGNPRVDTPWNAFTPDNILVCTLWKDEIVKVFDDEENRERQFIKIGGKMREWRGPAKKHGEDAQNNLQRAFKDRLRVVGYEAEPAYQNGTKSIDRFYLDRAYELQRMGEITHGGMLRRLHIAELLAERHRDEVEIVPGAIYELVAPKGDFPGRDKSSASNDASDPEQNGSADVPDEEHTENLSNEEYAVKVIPLLIAHVLQQQDDVMQTLTYEEVADRLDRRNKHGEPYPRGLGKILGRAMEIIDSATREFGDLPYLTTIVVSKTGKSKGLPGIGVRERWKDYDLLSTEEKAAKVLAEHLRILRFGPQWNDVLAALKIAPMRAEETTPPKRGGWGCGGESDAHKALKAYVKSHPELFGADDSFEAFDEYWLRSGDSIDVFFRSDKAWIGVEVKSRVSLGNDLDLQRGLFQVVKYEAVLRAQALADDLPVIPTIKVLLVIEDEIPSSLKAAAQKLKIDMRENVKPVEKDELTEMAA